MATTTIKWNHPVTAKMKEGLEWHGCRFEKVSDKKWLITMPAGWTMQVISDPQFTNKSSTYYNFIDDKERPRVEAFVMHSGGRQRTECTLLPRYSFTFEEQPGERVMGVAKDGKKPIFRSESYLAAGSKSKASRYAATQAATGWLDEHYPDHRNPQAYWD